MLTAAFLIVILGRDQQGGAGRALRRIAIGLALTVAHLVGIPVTNASLNPARSIASALFATNGAWGQIWLFIVGPLAGGALGAIIWRYVLSPGESPAGVGQKN